MFSIEAAITVIALSFAVFGQVVLQTQHNGPWRVFDRLRNLGAGVKRKRWFLVGSLGEILYCIYCQSTWLSLGWVVAFDYFQYDLTLFEMAFYWMAVQGFVLMWIELFFMYDAIPTRMTAKWDILKTSLINDVKSLKNQSSAIKSDVERTKDDLTTFMEVITKALQPDSDDV